jgi:hypothetical protein
MAEMLGAEAGLAAVEHNNRLLNEAQVIHPGQVVGTLRSNRG